MSAPILQIFADPGLAYVDLYVGQGTNWLKSDNTLEAFVEDNLSDYAVPAVETPSSGTTGMYCAAPPDLPAVGYYWIFWVVRLGNDVAIEDFTQRFGQNNMYWNGTTWNPVGTVSTDLSSIPGMLLTTPSNKLATGVGGSVTAAGLDTVAADVTDVKAVTVKLDTMLEASP